MFNIIYIYIYIYIYVFGKIPVVEVLVESL